MKMAGTIKLVVCSTTIIAVQDFADFCPPPAKPM